MRIVAFAGLILFPLLMGAISDESRPPLSEVYLLPGSSITIDGTTNLNSFSCSTTEVAGRGTIDPVSGGMNIYAGAFDCGIRRMNQDLRNALRADVHEFITFNIQKAELLQDADEDGASLVQAVGTLELAGSSQIITVRALAQRMDEKKVHLKGSHNLRMSTFEVTPPVRLLGMVRVHDEITVHFDLIAMGG